MTKSQQHCCFLFFVAATLFCGFETSHAAIFQESPGPQLSPEPLEPKIQPASGEGEAAIKQFQFSDELTCQLFAAEPDVANIVAFQRDFQGRVFVCETFRQEKNTGVEDNRSHGHWMDEELQAQTIQDRINYIRKYVPDADRLYTANDDRIRLIMDQNQDGIADKATVFAKGFNRLEMGTGADILSYRNQVYYTCIPDLFRLSDTDGDGIADQRESLHTGYGVRFAFRGHDLHGLIVGPDGRLYFSIGDRGYNVAPDIFDPTCGAVFRCELDGSNLEVFCTGLRNPQNLAFDDLGNLFTGDNNSDSGDRARWVYCVPGGDSGWRMYYQYLPDRGPFNREKIWHPFHAESPAYIVPPVENFSDGPSGLEYYPGTGFGDDYLGRFFLCDFRGTSVNSGVRSFRNQQVGAFWKLVDQEQPIWGILTTDLQFGSDGKLYVSDWVNGWVGENKGRIYSFTHAQYGQSEIVKEVESLLKNGCSELSIERLIELMNHRDRRVRQEAQFELVQRNEFEHLVTLARAGADRLPRVHALWGLGQLFRAKGQDSQVKTQGSTWIEQAAELINELSTDSDFEIRAQAAHLAGEMLAPTQPAMLRLLNNENLRVRYFAAMALAHIGDSTSLAGVAKMLAENNNADPILRHAGIMAIRGVFLRGLESENGRDAIASVDNLSKHPAPSVRLALAVACRKVLALPKTKRNENPAESVPSLLAQLLRDSDGTVSLEAARAVYDLPVNDLMHELAQVPTRTESGATRLAEPHLQDALVSRIIQANYRLGDLASAHRLGELAASSLPENIRVQAVKALRDWMTPANNDPLIHDWRPVDVTSRKLEDAQHVVAKLFTSLFLSGGAIRATTLEAVGKLQIPGLEAELEVATLSPDSDPELRVQALRSLVRLDRTRFRATLSSLQTIYQADASQIPLELALEMANLGAPTNKPLALSIYQKLVDSPESPVSIKQRALRSAGELTSEAAVQWFQAHWEKLENGVIPAELRLDIVLAGQAHADAEIKQSVQNYLAKLESASDPSDRYGDTLLGGDYESGRLVFETKTEVSCIRCHRVVGSDVAVGPNLSDIGLKRTRQHLLDSIVQPNKEIAEGFGQIKVLTLDGQLLTGLLKEDNDTEMKLLDADGKLISIAKDDIEDIQPGLSSMPLDLVKQLSLTELRDLIEFLARQNSEASQGLEHGRE